jgi:uncharacterized membrane protein (DUF2068 family)
MPDLWRTELFVCLVCGHAMPGASIDPVEEYHHLIVRPTVDGRRLTQCQRCGLWAVVDSPAYGTGKPLSCVELLERPRRGAALRSAILLRLVSVDRTLHTVAFAATAIAALAVRWNLTAIRGWASSMLRALSAARTGSGGVNAHGLTAGLLTHLSQVDPHSLLVLAAVAATYALVSGVEAIGLWRERRWAEYLTALSTAGFLPIEIHELIKRVTVVRLATMVVNLAIVGYLVVAKHLFGLRGPPREPLSPPVPGLPELVSTT